MDSQPKSTQDSLTNTSANKKFILIAEDDTFYSNIYKIKLTKEGYDVAVVGNGDYVLSLARERKPDLILLDLIMPVKDGFTTLKELKADPNLKDIKVVVFSNLSQDEDKQKVKELGAVDYLVKANMSIQEMVEKIGQYLN